MSVSFLLSCKHLQTHFVLFNKLVYNTIRKEYTNHYNVKYKMLYLINGNACVFRYFSIEQSFCSLAFSFRTDHYIAGKIVVQIYNVLWSKLSSKYLTVPDHNRFLYTAVKFKKRWYFPNVIACIDGKHTHFKCPTKAGSLVYN